MKTIYLHIGNFKTGTTSLQKICNNNFRKLDFYYPLACRPEKNTTNHGILSLSLLSEYNFYIPNWYKEQKISFESASDQIINEIDAQHCNKVLISSEEFFRICHNDNEGKRLSTDILMRLKNKFRQYDFKIIMYIREPLSLFESWYNQNNKDFKAKTGTRNFVVYFSNIREALLSQMPVYEAFCEVFGIKNIIVKSFYLKGNDHINEFFKTIGSNFRIHDKRKNIYNNSVNKKKIEIFRLIKFITNLEAGLKTDDLPLGKIEKKIGRINYNYEQINKLADHSVPSRLTLENLLLNYIDKAMTIKKILGCEVPFFRNNAILMEKYNLKLAYELMKAAQQIKPHEELINRKLVDYERKLHIA